MTDSKLADFEDRRLVLKLDGPVHHPFLQTVVGRMAYDDADCRAAVFLRDPDEHYFRKYEGYAVSVAVLQRVFGAGARVIYIAEQHDEKPERRIIEYDIVTFIDGTLIAYNPKENTVVEGERAVRAADDAAFSDKQRVLSEDSAHRVWEYGEFHIDS